MNYNYNCEPEIVESRVVRENYDEWEEVFTYSCENCDEYKCPHFFEYNNREDYNFVEGELE